MGTAEIASLAHEIRAFAAISAKLMAQDMEGRIARYCPGMSLPQYGVLRILACHPSTIKELSDRMMLAPSTLVPIIDRLENDGLVVRGKDPDDRRRTPLILTEQASRMLAQVPDVDLQDRLCQTLQDMGLAESRQLSQLLQALVSRLAEDQNIVRHVISMSPRATTPGSDSSAEERLARARKSAK